MNDADWELFVLVIGEHYPEEYQYRYKKSRTQWSDYFPGDPGVLVQNPANDVYQYRKPKQKENKMSERTPQQALRDAIDSGAVEAWIKGEDIQFECEGEWITNPNDGSWPPFQSSATIWRPAPPEPTKINWQPVVTGKEPKGMVLCAWAEQPRLGVHAVRFGGNCWADENEEDYLPPTHWAPMCNLPE